MREKHRIHWNRSPKDEKYIQARMKGDHDSGECVYTVVDNAIIPEEYFATSRTEA